MKENSTKPDRIVIGVSIDRDLDARLGDLAKRQERSKSQLLRMALREFLNEREGKKTAS